LLDVLRGRKPSLADDPWFPGAHERAQGSYSGLEVYGDLARIRERLEEDVRERPSAVMEALHIRQPAKLIWTTGHDERAIRSIVVGRALSGEDIFAVLAGRQIAAPEVLAAIPDQASTYFVLRGPLADVFRGIRAAYLESQSQGQRRAVRELWTRLQQRYGFDSETEVLDQLSDHFIVHTWPPHPLKLPALWSVWIQVHGDWRLVARAVDRMMTAWQESLNDEGDDLIAAAEALIARSGSRRTTAPAPNSSKSTATTPNALKPAATRRAAFRLSPQVRREPDGLWSLQLGLINPAVAVTQGWIVIAWSPEAVRANLNHLDSPLATAPSP
ncbi:MAG: hypothetical protein HY718_17605, partial [Planctomycetes bacterium]|nr:hypothetical protein [Planctomycetota bacterium]